MHQYIVQLAKQSKIASLTTQSIGNNEKSLALQSIHQLLAERKDIIIKENQKDLSDAKGGISQQLYKRLDLQNKFDSLLQGVLDVNSLDDPTAKVTLAKQLDDDLELYRVTCPVGVLLIIFEARPEVVVQISCLAIKSGNAVILKGGKEAAHSNKILFETIQEALLKSNSGIPANAVQLVTSRDEIATLLSQDKYVDLVIPRGSNQLVRYVQENTRIPVLGHADGICSVYVDESADITKAMKVVVDGKINYPAACNATEKLLIHKSLVSTHLNQIVNSLLEKKVTIRAEDQLFEKLSSSFPSAVQSNQINLAVEGDFETEFLDLEIAIKTVDSLMDAIEHINTFGSHHTDCIVTENEKNAKLFMSLVDSAGVYWNASTRFADGFRYGFGAEIGVSTNKTHARGPVGLEGLLIYKYRLYGNGHCVGEYSDGTRQYHRKDLDLKVAQSKLQ
ncbi:Aldehyde/histidinol dehydrogenase [Globomyces pollinis-pini]|nr:Aldehyde/histidinol dehydrogenase [Globomyces pollinis-pini]